MTYEQVLTHFHGVKQVPGGHRARCPGPNHANGDRNPSLSITKGDRQPIILTCRSQGCDPKDILQAAGLKWSDVMNENGNGARARAPRGDAWIWTAPDGRKRKQFRIDGEKKWQVQGISEADRKGPLNQRHLLYLTHHRAGAAVHYLTEGASSADALHAAGVESVVGRPPATPSAESLKRFSGDAPLVVVPDYDEAGYKQAATWAKLLRERGRAVSFIDLVTLNHGRKPAPKWDVRDWVRDSKPADAAADLADATTPNLAPLSAGIVYSHLELAELWTEQRGEDWRNVCETDTWRRWTDAAGWRDDVERRLLLDVGATCRKAWRATAKAGGPKKDRRGAGSAGTIKAAASLAAPMLPTRLDEWDGHDHLLGLPDGQVLDLNSGQARAQTRSDLIMKSAGCAFPDPGPPKTGTLLDTWFREKIPEDTDLEFLGRFIGYMLSGDTSEQSALWIHGPTTTGKSTLVALITALLGEYAMTISGRLLAQSKLDVSNQRDYTLAQADGKRGLVAVEWKENTPLDGAFFASLTGEDDIHVRPIGKAPFTYKPSFKLLLASNYLPTGGIDGQIIRRIAFIEMSEGHRGKEVPGTADTLIREHLPAFAGWALAGYLRWREHGLKPFPPSDALEEVAETTDHVLVQRWIDLAVRAGKLVRDPDGFIGKARLAEVLAHFAPHDVTLRRLQTMLKNNVPSKKIKHLNTRCYLHVREPE